MKVRLINKKLEAKETKSFFFQPERKIQWLPGQFFYFTIPKLNYPDPKGSTRHFTISSSPTEGDTLRITTRLSSNSGFKKTLDELEIGSLIDAEGPNGTFILDESVKGNQILIAGGIGITPFRSFIKYNLDKNLTSTNLYLIYSNPIPEEITFREELETITKTAKNIKLFLTITKPEETQEVWSGLTGRIDENMLKNIVKDIESPTFWLCGPPPMVEALEKVLGQMQITSDKIRSEKFTGY